MYLAENASKPLLVGAGYIIYDGEELEGVN